ncbi:hypothetical protein SUGI_1061780 [Cryptomeria japonica]|nr:hypothetical protein SUGI_1061780 [Cryptomeria japonica]
MESKGVKIRERKEREGNAKYNGCWGVKIAPRGCVAVYVGEEEEEQKERFIIPIHYLHHPFFEELLEAAEATFGFNHNGPLKIPCNVDRFKKLQRMIRKGQAKSSSHIVSIYKVTF